MAWADHPNISAIVWAGLPGQESGNSLADVLFGDVNPSGRLPYTIAKSVSDYPARIEKSKDIRYTEDLRIGYRHFENKVQAIVIVKKSTPSSLLITVMIE